MKTVFEFNEFFSHDDGDKAMERAFDILNATRNEHPEFKPLPTLIKLKMTAQKSQTLKITINDPNLFDWKRYWTNVFWASITIAGLIYLTH